MGSPENMSFPRKIADKAVEIGNTVDKFTIAVGILFLSAPTIAVGVLSLMTGKYIQNRLRTA